MDTARAHEAAGAAVLALRRGDAAEARRLFEVAVESGPVSAPLLAFYGQSCRATGAPDAAEAAADRALALQPGELRALILKGDCRATAGDDRAASSFYGLVLRAAPGLELPEDVLADVQRIDIASRAIEARFQGSLEQQLAARGVHPAEVSRRFAQSLDLLATGKPLYFQQPSSFFFPGLPQVQFYEREMFPWLAEVEAAVPAMQAELRSMLAESDGFVPYVERHPGRPVPANPLLDDPKWGALYIWKGGELQAEVAARCPATVSALEHAPIPRIAGRSPMALFSRLKPGTHIIPHNGLLNTRLICHVPLIVPPGCRLRVGNEVREWEEGRTLIFDDSIEHEAWNDGAEDRIVLLFEIWRPELSEAERTALTALFETISAYGALGDDAG